MSPAPVVNLLRILFVIFAASVGRQIGDVFFDAPNAGILGGSAVGLAVVLMDRLLLGISLRMFSAATFGLLLGFITARLLLASEILAKTSEDVRWLVSLSIYTIVSYIGMMLAVRSNRDEFALIIPYVRFRAERAEESPILVDSNVIIDGRLPEIAVTGFLSNSFIVPQFILQELQTLADSSDAIKRDKGRMALARLEELKKSTVLKLTVTENALDPFAAVDARLVQLAKITNARLLSNDHNLCSIARVQGVTALNLNDLARALRSGLNTGDEVEVQLSKEGRDAHQAVGYLKDGTMIVVNQARPYMGRTVPVVITSVVQTSAGRLFFAELRLPAAAA